MRVAELILPHGTALIIDGPSNNRRLGLAAPDFALGLIAARPELGFRCLLELHGIGTALNVSCGVDVDSSDTQLVRTEAERRQSIDTPALQLFF